MFDSNRGGEAHQIKVGLQHAAMRQNVRLARVLSPIKAGWLYAEPGDLVYVTEEAFNTLNTGHRCTMLEWEEAPPPAADDPGGPQPDGAASSPVQENQAEDGLRADVPGAPVFDDEDDAHRMVGGPAQTPLKGRKQK